MNAIAAAAVKTESLLIAIEYEKTSQKCLLMSGAFT